MRAAPDYSGPDYDIQAGLSRRREILREGLDLANHVGVEIGPLTSPVVTKSEGQVFYIDHANTDEIAAKYRCDLL